MSFITLIENFDFLFSALLYKQELKVSILFNLQHFFILYIKYDNVEYKIYKNDKSLIFDFIQLYKWQLNQPK